MRPAKWAEWMDEDGIETLLFGETITNWVTHDTIHEPRFTVWNMINEILFEEEAIE
jgi:hypothetical protein